MATFSGYNPYMESKYGLKRSSYGVLKSDGIQAPSNSYGVLKSDSISKENIPEKWNKAGAAKYALEGLSGFGSGMQNAFISNLDAASLDFQGKQASDISRKASRQAIGSQVVSTAANGIQMTGSALDALDMSQREAEYDAVMKKAVYDVAASAAKVKSKQERTGAIAGLIQGFGGALSSLKAT